MPMMDLEELKIIAHGIASQFGESCEVVIHDMRTEQLENSIVHIENGSVSHRNVGDGPSHVVLWSRAHDDGYTPGRYAYMTKTKDGRFLRSTTMNIRDDVGQLMYLLCINYDMTDFVMVQQTLEKMTASSLDSTNKADRITTSVSDLLDDLLAQAESLVGKSAHLMTRLERLQAIAYLHNQGAFLISKSSEKIAEYFHISKFTLYSDLNAVKDGD